jgi:hypothetical protein
MNNDDKIITEIDGSAEHVRLLAQCPITYRADGQLEQV